MTLSTKLYFEKFEPGSLRTDKPCDSGYVWTALDNIAYMLDASPKYRINFMTGFGGSHQPIGGITELAGTNRVWCFYFVTELVDQRSYPGYDLRASFRGGDDDADIRVSIVLPNVQAPVNEFTSGVLATFTATSTADTPELLVDELVLSQPTEAASGTLPFQQAPDADGNMGPAIGYQVLLKILIEAEDGSEGPLLLGLQLREFSP